MKGFQVHAADNVATVLDDVEAGAIVPLIGPLAGRELTARDRIALGHKIAVMPIPAGEAVIKFGVVIGLASRAIAAGEWVHLHNCRSQLDTRSGSFDLYTGAPREEEHV